MMVFPLTIYFSTEEERANFGKEVKKEIKPKYTEKQLNAMSKAQLIKLVM